MMMICYINIMWHVYLLLAVGMNCVLMHQLTRCCSRPIQSAQNSCGICGSFK